MESNVSGNGAVAAEQFQGQASMEMGNNSSLSEELVEGSDETNPVTEAASKEKEARPMRMYFRDGPIIRRRLTEEYGVANKRCDDCGKVGDLTCFSNGFKHWGSRRVTKREMNRKCTECKQRWADCPGHPPYPYQWEIDPFRAKRAFRCGYCRRLGHNQRTCPSKLMSERLLRMSRRS